jgi:hypothetical protein
MSGRKTFVGGDILLASELNDFLMDQSVMVFANATARNNAIPSPSEGMLTYLTNNDGLFSYSGAAWVPAANSASLGPGSIVQVVSTIKTDTFTLNNVTFTDVPGLSATITPTSATSKILVQCFANVGGSSAAGVRGRLLRETAAIAVGDLQGVRVRATFQSTSSADHPSQMTAVFLDSPNTTAARTYKLQISGDAPSVISINRSVNFADVTEQTTTVSSITLMEVKA